MMLRSIVKVFLILSVGCVVLIDAGRRPRQVCKTRDCANAAQEIKSKIDDSVDPCQDFYHFACGQWMNKTTVPEDKTLVDTFSIVGDTLKEQLKTIITSPIERSDIEPFRNVKNLYKSCMNKDLIEERGLKPILDIMDSMGGWPAVKGDAWDESAWTWEQAVIDCRNNGYSNDFILDFSVGNDLKNSSNKLVDIDQADLGLNQVFLKLGIDFKVSAAYNSFQTDMAILYGADPERAKKDMLEAFEFEAGMANISLTPEQRRNATAIYNPFTLEELQKKFPYTKWMPFFNALLPSVSQVTENDTIIVYDVPFFEQFGDLLARTPKRAVANYMMWRVAAASTNWLTDKLRKRQLDYAKALIGQQEETPRWKECIDGVTSNLEIAVSALYVRKYFPQSSKAVALDMVNAIKSEFEEIVKKVDWMDDETRVNALDKLHKMITHIGYPDELMDDSKLIEYYKNVHVDDKKYLESTLSIEKFKTDLQYEKLRQVVNKTDWKTHSKAAVVNAAYNAVENSIRFPAGILQGQFFSANRPKYMNFAAIGSIIGHEITHGFDDQGRQFDANGNLVDWWSKSTGEAFVEKAKCIIDEYGNFTDKETELNLNGINTQGENIADNGGLKEAYHAYLKYTTKNGYELPLRGLNYNTKQLFWISYAQTWCAVFRPEELKKRILTGVHSPNQFRVQGTFVNRNSFAEDFICAAGTPMNPTHKCAVW